MTYIRHILISAITTVFLAGGFSFAVFAAFNPEINYQGKLTDSGNVAVADGVYHMKFRLYTAPTGGSAVWEENRSYAGGDRITLASGLFSVMLGSSTSLTSINFNQTLYLEVEIGGTASTTWEILSPRKKLGAVPAAFEADKLDGVDSASFLRSDADDSASGLLTFSGGFISQASSTVSSTLRVTGESIFNNLIDASRFVATSTTATSTFAGGLAVETSGLVYDYSTNNVGIGTASPTEKLDISGNIKSNGTLTMSADVAGYEITAPGIYASDTLRVDGALISTIATTWNLADSQTSALNIESGLFNIDTQNLRIGIGTTSPYAKLSVEGSSALGNSALAGYFTATSTTATSTFSGGLSLAGGGISPGFNFSTTTRFYQNDQHFLTSSTTAAGNLAMGYQSGNLIDENGGLYSTYFGYQAGKIATSSVANTGFGYQVLSSTVDVATSDGDYNTGVGYTALKNNTTGRYNMALGAFALAANTTGHNNLGLGGLSLQTNTTGVQNVAIGANSLNANVSGGNNLAIGRDALKASTGSNNLVIGTFSGDALTSGGNNLLIGYNSDFPSPTGSNQMSIGNLIYSAGVNGVGTGFSTGNIGVSSSTPWAKLSVHGLATDSDTAKPLFLVASSTASATTTHFIITNTGNVGVGTSSPKFNLSVQSASEGDMFQLYDTDGNCRQDPDSGGITTTCSSDIRLKTDITETAPVLGYFLGLPIKDYTVIASGDRFTGVIAQELLEKYPELVVMGEDGYYGVKEIGSWKVIKAIQELNLKIEELNSQFSNSNFQSIPNDSISNDQSIVVPQSFDWILDQFRNIGIAISDGVITAKEFVADKITAKKVVTEALEMKDSITGDTYCVRISEGEWNKFRGTCGEVTAANMPTPTLGVDGTNNQPPAETETTPPAETIPPQETEPTANVEPPADTTILPDQDAPVETTPPAEDPEQPSAPPEEQVATE